MNRKVFRPVGFERVAIALTGLCIASLWVLVALDYGRVIPEAKATTARDDAATSSSADPYITEPEPFARSSARAKVKLNPMQAYTVASSDKLSDVFLRIGYQLDHVREHGRVPRVFVANIPSDLPRIQAVEKRKVMFIQTALPLILHVNEVIQHDRERIKQLRDMMRADDTPPQEDVQWLEAKAAEYGLDAVDFDRLLRRVDIIPPSLALAQSAEESGWGTSRFAQQGNALFGQRVWAPHRKGLVPDERPEGKTFRVRAFDHLIDGVKAYAKNLNVHRAYDAFRSKRAALRREGEALDGGVLARTLETYSERGTDYVRTLLTIMRVNGLRLFDRARLGERLTQDEQGLEPPDA